MKPGWPDLAWAALIGAATLVANGALFNSAATSGAMAWLYSLLQFGLPAVLFIRLADAAVQTRRLSAWLAYTAAVMATVLLGVWVIAPALQPLLGKPEWWTPFNDFVLASTTAVWHALGVAIYLQVRASHRAQAHLLALQAKASAHQRQLAGAQLVALQARVEPELLFERLQCIATELREHAPTARARLAALIALLRAVQPHQQAAASSLAREVQALQAYAKLISADARCSERLHLDGQDWPEWPLAPLVLLPLVRPLLADGQTKWSLTLHGQGENTELRLQALGPGATSTRQASQRAPLSALNERLQAVHGARAGLTLQLGNEEHLPCFSLRWPVSATAAAVNETAPS